MSRSAIAAVVLGCLIPGAAVAQGPLITLRVIDPSGVPVHGARVGTPNDSTARLTDSSGVVRFRVATRGAVELTVRRLGFEPGTILVVAEPGDTTRAQLVLRPAAQSLPDVTVLDSVVPMSPMLAGFERRRLRRVGTASYVTREDIQQQRPVTISDLLRRVTAIKVIDSAGVLVAVSRRSAKPVITLGQADDLAPSALREAVDGDLREEGFAVNAIPPVEIHGIEIFPGPASIPAEYASMRREAGCGLIAIWTRR